ncbi:hypothetical protein CWE15_05305 [Aliidiomarina taiwanensis]|uniref:MSHA biogenesis protein MshK n=1 Tax=Aliidiomarina taiwanensis TaxID=946228 RepID=A0A432X7H4_9GAMM|nr:hypothetical protein [Aliidiomarina taiwanensis]RUO42821.1 hypothetical protein CWE15_05305 [Aliidiomarina taiwanensis]
MAISRFYIGLGIGFGIGGLLCSMPAWAARPTVDPTRPPASIQAPAAAQARAPQLHLQSIWFQQGRGRALIDGRNYYVGDQVGPWTVHAIHASTVLLRQNEDELVLAVFAQDAIKRGRDNK